MIEEIFIDALVHGTVGIQKVHVLAKTHGMRERVLQVFDHDLFLGAEPEGVIPVHGREVMGLERVDCTVQSNGIVVPIHLSQEHAVVHLILRVSLDQLPLQLKDQHGDRLLERIHPLFMGIGLFRKQHQVSHTDAVSVFQDLVVAIFDIVVDANEDAGRVARRGSHPQNVVIAPLNIELVLVAHQQVHDQVRVLAPVENIAQNVQAVHKQPLCQSTERHDEIIRALRVHDGLQDLGVITRAIVVLILLGVQQLVDDEGEFLRHGLADFGAGILGRRVAGQFDQPVQHLPVQKTRDLSALLHPLQFFHRIIDQRA